LKLVFDTYHFGHDAAVLANLPEIAPHVGVVHLGDRVEPHAAEQDRRRLGEGRLQLGDLIRGLVDAGYTGDFDVELIGRDIEPGQYEEVLASSLDYFERVLAPVSGN
jgi:sugar phosphate isomerase/epimerase